MEQPQTLNVLVLWTDQKKKNRQQKNQSHLTLNKISDSNRCISRSTERKVSGPIANERARGPLADNNKKTTKTNESIYHPGAKKGFV